MLQYSMFARQNKKSGLLLTLAVFSITLLTTASFFYGKMTSPKNLYISGVDRSSPNDTYSYLAWIEQSTQGNILFKQLYSTEDNRQTFFHPIFFVLGRIASLTNVSNITVFQVAKILSSIALLTVIFSFIRNFFDSLSRQIYTLLLVGLGSGLGIITGSNSPDIWMTELITFTSMSQTLLNTIALILIVLILNLALKNHPERKNNSKQYVIYNIVLLLLLGLTHAYEIIVAFALLSLIALYYFKRTSNTTYIRDLLYIILGSLPIIFWLTYSLSNNQSLGIWATMQTNVPAPTIQTLISGYGLILFFFLIATGLIIYRREVKFLTLYFWIIAGFTLMYLPIFSRFQRKFSLGLHIALTIVASYGIFWFTEKLTKKNKIRLLILGLVFVLSSSTTFYILAIDKSNYDTLQPTYYLTVNEHSSFEWLKQNTNYNDIVLSGYRSGNLIPGISGRAVYLGHYDQTVNFYLKYELLPKIISSTPKHTDPLAFLLKDYKINYIVVDHEIRSWGGLSTENRSYLTLAYQNSDVQIYKVQF